MTNLSEIFPSLSEYSQIYLNDSLIYLICSEIWMIFIIASQADLTEHSMNSVHNPPIELKVCSYIPGPSLGICALRRAHRATRCQGQHNELRSLQSCSRKLQRCICPSEWVSSALPPLTVTEAAPPLPFSPQPQVWSVYCPVRLST